MKPLIFKRSRPPGLTLVEMIIMVAIIGLLASIAIPNVVRIRAMAQRNACIANLKQIDEAKKVWALETHRKEGAPCSMADLAPYLKSIPVCPSGTAAYIPNPVGTPSACPNAARRPDHTLQN